MRKDIEELAAPVFDAFNTYKVENNAELPDIDERADKDEAFIETRTFEDGSAPRIKPDVPQNSQLSRQITCPQVDKDIEKPAFADFDSFNTFKVVNNAEARDIDEPDHKDETFTETTRFVDGSTRGV